MGTHANVEEVPSCVRDHVLVRGNARSFEAFTGNLLKFVTHHVCRRRELVAGHLLLATIINPDLGVWNASAIARLGVRFPVLVTITAGGAASHPLPLEYAARAFAS